MFAELLNPVLLRPVFLSGPLKGNNTLFTSLSNELELEWHENTLAFDYAIKMLEAPLSVPEGFSRCQPLLFFLFFSFFLWSSLGPARRPRLSRVYRKRHTSERTLIHKEVTKLAS